MSKWSEILKEETSQPYFINLMSSIKMEIRQGLKVYPDRDDIMNAFKLTPFDQVKVVIIGQDPYHGAGQAHGLSFSVRKGNRIPPSLQNIYKELVDDVGITMPTHGELTQWAEQGVLLLNTSLTVREASPNSHQNIGWSQFTDKAIRVISENREGIIFLLWGKHAQEKASLIDETKHSILLAAHPSPFSAHRGFFSCKHFSKVNEILTEIGETPINWQIT